MSDENGNSEARIGWGTGFYVAKPDGAMFEVDEVTEVPFGDETADDVEATHMKSPKKRKEYIRGLIEAGEANLVVNYIPGSETDVLLREMHTSGRVAAFRTILNEETGQDMVAIDGFLYVRTRSRSVTIGDRMTCTYGVRFTGDQEEGAYTAPAPANP